MFLAAQMDERTKKVLLVLCALFIILLLIFGGIYVAIEKYMKKESKKMDNYMYDLLKLRLVKTPFQFKKAVFYHEERNLFNGCKWSFRVILLLTGFAILLTYICFLGDLKRFFTAVFDLIPIIKWPTVGETNEALSAIPGASLLSGPDWMPASVFPAFISKNPNFSDPVLYASTIYYVCILVCVFSLIRAILACIARVHRGMKMSTQVFIKDLDKFDIGTVQDYSESINSDVPNQEKYVETSGE